MTSILAILEESIILKSQDTIPYSNIRGQKILSYLKKLGNTQNEEKVLDLNVFQMHKEIGHRTDEVDLDENHKKAFNENRFSLKDFYTLDTSILEKYIFQLNEDQQFV